MLLLASTKPIASGDFRDCYRHPEDEGRCVKIVRRLPDDHHLGSVERLLGRGVVDPNQREYNEYWRHRTAGVPLERYFPTVHGFVETDLGKGLCLDFLTGTDGRGPVSLLDYLDGDRPAGIERDFVLRKVAEFARFCSTYGILASCDEPRNMGLLRDEDGYRLVAYDLKIRQSKEFIPMSAFLPFVRRRKIARRFDRRIAQLRNSLAAG
jgi:hypothetical protein